MVALSPSPANESYIEPSRYAWLRSGTHVPTTDMPACEPLVEFAVVLENRTSRALGESNIRIEILVVSSAAASSCVVIWLETCWIEHNGEAFDSRIGQMYLRARFYDMHRFTTLDPYSGNIRDPLSFNKFGFVHANPVMGVDPSGWEFSLGGFKASFAITVGWAGFSGAANLAAGKSITQGLAGGFVGAISAQIARFLPNRNQIFLEAAITSVLSIAFKAAVEWTKSEADKTLSEVLWENKTVLFAYGLEGFNWGLYAATFPKMNESPADLMLAATLLEVLGLGLHTLTSQTTGKSLGLERQYAKKAIGDWIESVFAVLSQDIAKEATRRFRTLYGLRGMPSTTQGEFISILGGKVLGAMTGQAIDSLADFIADYVGDDIVDFFMG